MKILRLLSVATLFIAHTAVAQSQSIAMPTTSLATLDASAFQPQSGFAPSSARLVTQSPSGMALYHWSAAALIAANGADAFSSWRQIEANPVIGAQGARFGYSSLVIKSGFAGGSLLIEHVVLRHRPDLYRKMAWLNFASAGGLGAVAFYNTGLR